MLFHPSWSSQRRADWANRAPSIGLSSRGPSRCVPARNRSLGDDPGRPLLRKRERDSSCTYAKGGWTVGRGERSYRSEGSTKVGRALGTRVTHQDSTRTIDCSVQGAFSTKKYLESGPLGLANRWLPIPTVGGRDKNVSFKKQEIPLHAIQEHDSVFEVYPSIELTSLHLQCAHSTRGTLQL